VQFLASYPHSLTRPCRNPCFPTFANLPSLTRSPSLLSFQSANHPDHLPTSTRTEVLGEKSLSKERCTQSERSAESILFHRMVELECSPAPAGFVFRPSERALRHSIGESLALPLLGRSVAFYEGRGTRDENKENRLKTANQPPTLNLANKHIIQVNASYRRDHIQVGCRSRLLAGFVCRKSIK
jgi:hypothetical protein